MGLKAGTWGSGLTGQSMVLPRSGYRCRVGSVAQGGMRQLLLGLLGRRQRLLPTAIVRLALAGLEAGIVCNHLAPWEARKSSH